MLVGIEKLLASSDKQKRLQWKRIQLKRKLETGMLKKPEYNKQMLKLHDEASAVARSEAEEAAAEADYQREGFPKDQGKFDVDDWS
jgi:hypothetical protein